jgi:hypothetical protein
MSTFSHQTRLTDPHPPFTTTGGLALRIPQADRCAPLAQALRARIRRRACPRQREGRLQSYAFLPVPGVRGAHPEINRLSSRNASGRRKGKGIWFKRTYINIE